MLKKLPIPICGLMLGLAALGNLIQTYSETLRLILGFISGLIGILFILKVYSNFDKFKEEMKKPVMASVFGTFPMALMLLSGYLKPFVGNTANLLYYFAIIVHIILIIYFTLHFIVKLDIKKVFASYYIIYVGIVAASVVSPLFGSQRLGQIFFWFGLISLFVLFGIVGFRYYKYREIPEMLTPLFCITTAPTSLLLAGYIQSFETKNIYLVYFLLILSQVIYFYVLTKLVKYIRLVFYPSFSAFTFPFVITAISLKMTNGYLNNVGNPIGILSYLVLFETIVAVVLTLYTVFRYIEFIIKK